MARYCATSESYGREKKYISSIQTWSPKVLPWADLIWSRTKVGHGQTASYWKFGASKMSVHIKQAGQMRPVSARGAGSLAKCTHPS